MVSNTMQARVETDKRRTDKPTTISLL